MKKINLSVIAVLTTSFLSLFSLPVFSQTHLGVGPKNLINLESFCLSPDNSLTNQFYYDRNESAPFSIPHGYTFVITDIIVQPNCDGSGQNANFNTLALVEDPHVQRKFTMGFSGTDVKLYALTGGLAYPAGSVPRPRNTPSSTGSVQIQLMGYFISGVGLTPGAPRF